jgi:hypothetical protein
MYIRVNTVCASVADPGPRHDFFIFYFKNKPIQILFSRYESFVHARTILLRRSASVTALFGHINVARVTALFGHGALAGVAR